MQMILPDGVRLTYRFDRCGHLTLRTRTDAAGHSDTVRYAYDSAGRPIREERNGTVVNTAAYDSAGRRCLTNGQKTPDAPVWVCQTSRMAQGTVLTVTQSPGDRQASAAETEEPPLLFTSDGKRRLTEVAGPLTRRYRLAGGRVLSVRLSDADEAYPLHAALFPVYRRGEAVAFLLRRYDLRHGRVVWSDALYRLVRDPLGDIVALTDRHHRVVAEYDYDLFGRCRLLRDDSPDAAGHLNPFRFRGYYRHPATGLYCHRGFCYDPDTGQVFSDPVGEMLSRC